MPESANPIRRWLRWAILPTLVLVFWALFKILTVLPEPAPPDAYAHDYIREEMAPDLYRVEDSWIKRNRHGLYEMYLEGDPIALGLKNGILSREQIQYQEEVFVERLRELVPGRIYIRFLKQLIVWMNRNMDRHVPLEYQQEIFGVALQASDSFNFIGPPYGRILNYHAAHDIGHALQNMNLVACTAAGVKGQRSASGKLLVGRNFDFSMGEKFARDKIMAFYRPEQGHAFASITWGGLIGVVSGMNEAGLALSLNAAKSGIPRSTKTPVSILARQILQYASTIEEALEIAGQTEVFVAESFLLASARDGKVVVLEKSPEGMDLYDPGGDSLILTNHFQSKRFFSSERTQENIREGASMYRWERTRELLEGTRLHDVESMADLLRDQQGLGDVPIGMGNEKAVNQLIAHHSVIFEPEDLRMWVSTGPYQLGTYICYDLGRVFSDSLDPRKAVFQEDRMVGEDPFLHSASFAQFRRYQAESARIRQWLDQKDRDKLDLPSPETFVTLNPHFYYSWYLAGEVYRVQGLDSEARHMYERALELEIPRLVDRQQVEEALEDLSPNP